MTQRTSIHHAGFVVADLARSIEFYEKAFGAEVEMQFSAAGEEVAKLHGLEEADFTIAMLRIGDARIELFEFRVPEDRSSVPVRACDIGTFHVAIQVEDARAKYQELVDEGIEFTRPPVQAGKNVVAFCTDPDGNRLELLQLPAFQTAS